MIQYLEVHDNQEYLVKRIRTLAKGGCMSSFNATGGDSFKVSVSEAKATTAATITSNNDNKSNNKCSRTKTTTDNHKQQRQQKQHLG